MRIHRFTRTTASLATAYEDQTPQEDLVIPESFDGISDADLNVLYSTATEAFDALYSAAGEDMSSEDLDRLAALTDGVEALAAEIAARETARAERAEKAAALAARVRPEGALSADTAEAGDAGDEEPVTEEDEEEDEQAEDENAADAVVASGRPEVRIPLSAVRRNTAVVVHESTKNTMKDVAFAAGDGLGVAVGAGLDWDGIGKAIDRKLQGYNASTYATAAATGRHLKEQHSIVTLRREFPSDLRVSSTDRAHVEEVLARAANESRLPGGSLVAAGGWCAPSEVLYDLIELESRDGLLSLPEVEVSRGGISFTPGPSFADIFTDITGFTFTEAQDIAGEYQPGVDGNVEGPKPCYTVECPDFSEERLRVSGVCIQAGLLMSRGYPEVISRVVRGALIAHEHRLNAQQIATMVAGSTQVTLPSEQAGAAAPILTAIELQVEHYRYSHRLRRDQSLEAVFPAWTRGAIRSDLSRRLGVDLLSVTDAQIIGWFRERGVNPQFVYNWQAIDSTAASAFTAWPDSVSFLLYAAGTWIKGSAPVISLDTVYDSTLLANNDYTALFTEEGWLMLKRGHDSRVVTVPLTASGATHQGVIIEHNGTFEIPEPVAPGDGGTGA